MTHYQELAEYILMSQSIQYALFSSGATLEIASASLKKWLSREIHEGASLAYLFPELETMMDTLLESISKNKEFEIEDIAQPAWHNGSGYMSLLALPYRDKILLVIKDTTNVGALKQGLMQQKNEMSILNERLEKTQTQLAGIATRFIPGQVMDSLLADKKSPAIKGSRRDATIVFADLRGFTNWSQQREPEEVFDMINRFLSQAVDYVFAYNGTLDKFLGDGFMVIFNAPHEQPDHILRAVHFAHKISQIKHEVLQFGVGIHTGPVMSGNIGTATSMNYTVLGHTVNYAKRLEENAQAGDILISEHVAQHIHDVFDAEFYTQLQLKSDLPPEAVYRLLGARKE